MKKLSHKENYLIEEKVKNDTASASIEINKMNGDFTVSVTFKPRKGEEFMKAKEIALKKAIDFGLDNYK